jgi:dipicolinate synthase subunit A
MVITSYFYYTRYAQKIKHIPLFRRIMWHERVIYMYGHIFYTAGHTDALEYAAAELKRKGLPFASQPDKTVTHLLLPVPSFEPDGKVKGDISLASVLELLPRNVTVFGGNLGNFVPAGYKTVDLLQDPMYLAENADITAHCAVKLAMAKLPVTLRECPVLVIGWGRIGKCLADLLKRMGAIVTVAVRKDSDRAILSALAYDTENIRSLGYGLVRYRVIFNTVPTMIIPSEAIQFCAPDCLKIDLASAPGMDAPDVIWARGLPNKDAPESSGKLIARSVLRLGVL